MKNLALLKLKNPNTELFQLYKQLIALGAPSLTKDEVYTQFLQYLLKEGVNFKGICKVFDNPQQLAILLKDHPFSKQAEEYYQQHIKKQVDHMFNEVDYKFEKRLNNRTIEREETFQALMEEFPTYKHKLFQTFNEEQLERLSQTQIRALVNFMIANKVYPEETKIFWAMKSKTNSKTFSHALQTLQVDEQDFFRIFN